MMQHKIPILALLFWHNPKSPISLARWALVAKHLKNRNGKQCRHRWHNYLNPAVKKTPWTEDEDRLIYNAHKQWGNQWAKIAELIPGGRTDILHHVGLSWSYPDSIKSQKQISQLQCTLKYFSKLNEIS